MSTTIHICASTESALQDLLLEEDRGLSNSFTSQQMSVIVTPNLSTNTFLKETLIASGKALLNVHFWNVSRLRKHLSEALVESHKLISNANLRLVFGGIAHNQFRAHPLTKACIQNAQLLLDELLEAFSAFGTFDNLPNDHLKALALQLFANLEKTSLATVQQVDNALLKNAAQLPKTLQNLVLFGFSEHHWHLNKLLQASLTCAHNAHVYLLHQHTNFLSKLWVNSWQKNLPTTPLITHTSECNHLPNSHFSITDTPQQAAKTLCLQALKILHENPSARIGIVFPSTRSTIARQVSDILSQLSVHHADSLGVMLPQEPSAITLQKWIAWQRSNTLDDLVTFAANLAENSGLKPDTFDRLYALLQKAFQELLTDASNACLSYAREAFDAENADLQAFFSHWQTLPLQASLEGFLSKAQAAFALIPDSNSAVQWNDLRLQLNETLLAQEIPKDLFLNWLQEVTLTTTRRRSPSGDHPYAKIHLVTAEEAVTQSWTDLLLTEINQTLWPPESSTFTLFDNSTENRRNRMQHDPNIGYWLPANYSYFFSASDRRKFFQQDFWTLVKLPTNSLYLTTFLDPSKTDSPKLSFLFHELYFNHRKETLDASVIQSIKNITLAQLDTFEKLTEKSINHQPQGQNEIHSPEKTLFAHEVRRCAKKPYDDFSFVLPENQTLSAKTWENLLLHPAHTWFVSILKTQPYLPFRQQDPSRLASGTWLHQWIALPKTVHNISAEKWHKHVIANSEKTRQMVQKSFYDNGLPMPDIWLYEWEKTRRSALNTIDCVLQQTDGCFYFSEISLPKPTCIHLPNHQSLSLSGRIDLLVLKDHLFFTQNPQAEALVIDFKTGDQGGPLVTPQGKGLQVALYALALQAWGYRQNVRFAIVHASPSYSTLKIQSINALEELFPLWNVIHQIDSTGIIGQHEPIRSKYVFAGQLPLATTAIDPEILIKKWNLTHPYLQRS
jgi:hypothetical protein